MCCDKRARLFHAVFSLNELVPQDVFNRAQNQSERSAKLMAYIREKSCLA